MESDSVTIKKRKTVPVTTDKLMRILLQRTPPSQWEWEYDSSSKSVPYNADYRFH